MGRSLIIKGADFSAVAVTQSDTPVESKVMLTLNVNVSGRGTVTGAGLYTKNTNAHIVATANSGFNFVRWSDGVELAERTVNVTGDMTLTAFFEVEAATGAWLFDYTDAELTAATTSLGAASGYPMFTLGSEANADILGKEITKIKFKCGAVGTISIYHTTTRLNSTAVKTLLAEVETNSNDVGSIVEKSVSFNVPSTGYIAFANDVAGVIKYDKNKGAASAKEPMVGPTGTDYSDRDLCIDLYAML